ncbi:alkaline shock response membrane anchor protein AmaP [Halobacillus salinarum]|uniref:Alkaline shock response membrane anchor protein AmaP n=1 Tax=Halobacillus salinarum TaxID=2932257 RepID=A0ABY4EI39_9BACI|nr:alkaline shock response membrane anchor protein AmaP [Halobacillus salinarum]UOQ44154.1 alkaline shock response membrane anchor protein AmaP [Halobacillus salinarum]
MRSKKFIYGLFAVLYLGVTIFGLGPVFFSDGPNKYRMYTLTWVIFIYIALAVILLIFNKKRKK